MRVEAEIDNLAALLQDEVLKSPSKAIEKLKKAAEEVGKSWSGSWFGYHARVYYQDFAPVPPGARFSKEWGLQETFSEGTVGDWVEYRFDDVRDEVYRRAGDPNVENLNIKAKQACAVFEKAKTTLISRISLALTDPKKDPYLEELLEEVRKSDILSGDKFVECLRPTGKMFSRDSNAIMAGLHTPAHISVLGQTFSIEQPFAACKRLATIAERVASHMQHASRVNRRDRERGNKVFIGHGKSKAWKELKDFLQDRLKLEWDEFNRVPIAGVTNIARLSEMLGEAVIAFLVLTAEDEQADGKVHARMNVVHEAGLFQGRLGFAKAIVLLEEGCEEFSNIQGLGQIRFPKGKISTVFEDIRRVLERERVIE